MFVVTPSEEGSLIAIAAITQRFDDPDAPGDRERAWDRWLAELDEIRALAPTGVRADFAALVDLHRTFDAAKLEAPTIGPEDLAAAADQLRAVADLCQ